jgi:hypothetical protein
MDFDKELGPRVRALTFLGGRTSEAVEKAILERVRADSEKTQFLFCTEAFARRLAVLFPIRSRQLNIVGVPGALEASADMNRAVRTVLHADPDEMIFQTPLAVVPGESFRNITEFLWDIGYWLTVGVVAADPKEMSKQVTTLLQAWDVPFVAPDILRIKGTFEGISVSGILRRDFASSSATNLWYPTSSDVSQASLTAALSASV